MMLKTICWLGFAACALSGCAVKTPGVSAWDCYRGTSRALMADAVRADTTCATWRSVGKAMLVDAD